MRTLIQEMVRERKQAFAARPRRAISGWGSVILFSAMLFLIVLLTDLFGTTLDGLNILWAPNAFLLAYLLNVPKWHWGRYLVASLVALLLSSAMIGEPWKVNLLYNLLNMIEVLTSAQLLRGRSAQVCNLTDARQIVRFIAFGVFAGPITAAALYGIIGHLVHYHAPASLTLEWIASDSLGIAVITPTILAILRNRWRQNPAWHVLVALLLLAALTVAAFTRPEPLLCFFLFPALLVILLRYDIAWAAMATLVVTAIGGSLTIHGMGPFAANSHGSILFSAVLFQIYIGCGVCQIYLTSMVMENLRSAKLAMRQAVAFHETVLANLNEVILVEDMDGRNSFVSQTSRRVLGLSPEQVMTLEPYALVGAEDREAVEMARRIARSSNRNQPVEFRLKQAGTKQVWIEAGLTLMRDTTTGVPLGILNILRDITLRKQQEEQLHEAYRALEALAITDALTHLANRRQFDKFVTAEWRRAMRSREPLSILVLDVDYFKTYNDQYGHLRGDSCLRQVAEAAQDIVMRSADLVARIGGEEFSVVLQGTDSAGAVEIAERIRRAVMERKIRHDGNPAGHVSISIGCATCIPAVGQQVRDLIDEADKALYEAKRSGRNRVCVQGQKKVVEEIRVAS